MMPPDAVPAARIWHVCGTAFSLAHRDRLGKSARRCSALRTRHPCDRNRLVAITRDEGRRVAALARLCLEPDEEERLTADLDHILEAFARLQTLDTRDVTPTAHVDDFGAEPRAHALCHPAAHPHP